MKNLVGQSFAIAGGHYRIVDVRRLGGDAMVYAERVCTERADGAQAASCGGAPQRAAPGRTAFHYGDIAPLLDAGGHA